MPYYFAKTLDLPFDEAVARTREALSQEGFGVITEIDVQKTLKAKIGQAQTHQGVREQGGERPGPHRRPARDHANVGERRFGQQRQPRRGAASTSETQAPASETP